MQLNVNTTQLNSREYKIILDTKAYTSIDNAKEKVLHILESQLATQNITFSKTDTKREKKVYYFDTDNQDLYRNKHFIIRFKEITSGYINYDVVFKVRDEDKELVKGYDLFKVNNQQQNFEIEEQKFEEDLLSHSASKYSISTELEYKNSPDLKIWNDVLSIFPNLKLSVSRDTPLSKVNDNILKIKETTFKLGELLFEGVKKAEVEFSLWCKNEESIPVISEFDIDVNAKDLTSNGERENDIFDNPVIVKIDNLYRNLQNSFTIDKNNTTKTEFFYDYKEEN